MNVIIISGPAGSGKTAKLNERRDADMKRGRTVTDIIESRTALGAVHGMIAGIAHKAGTDVYAYMDEVEAGRQHEIAEALADLNGTIYLVVTS